MGVMKRTRASKNGTKSSYWYTRIRINGNDMWRSVGKVGEVTKSVALYKEAELKRKIRLGQLDMIDAYIPTLSELKEEYIQYQKEVKQKRSWKKDKAHTDRFNKRFGNLKLSEITPKHIDDYKLNRLKQVKAVTVNRELEVLRHLFNTARKWKRFYGENPVSESGMLKTESRRIRILTLEEEQKLLECSSAHLVPIIKTALLTAMRLGELITLRWSDVDFDNNLITVRAEVSKSKKSRKIPISSALRKLLLEQKLISTKAGMVFLTNSANPYSPKNSSALKRTFTTARKRANLLDVRFHDLRHTSATRMAENGASVIAVKEICGHADIKTTLQYFHPDKSLTEAVEILAKFNKNCSQNGSHEIRSGI